MTFQLRVYVPDHPLIKHWLGVARDANTPNILFKTAMTELGRWLTYEATRHWLPTLETGIKTPITDAQATFINPQVPIAVVPLLRAGLALLDGAQTLLPLASTYHLGLVYNEEILDISCYLNKLPQQFHPETRIVVLEPMLATGRLITVAMDKITERGANPKLMRIISVVAAPPALQKLSKKYPTLNIYTAFIDKEIDDKG
ncbi:MAG: uracil phosphoribosyltransferase, partial [cyanobacterium endosymbiont of Rhopalodia yunnanensis]